MVCLCARWIGPAVSAEPPLADVHLHYNWDQVAVLDPAEAVARLVANDVALAVVSSKPPALALQLSRTAGGWIVPFFMPYLEPERKRDWFDDDRVLPAARAALVSGRFHGLGEMHLIVGFAPSLRARHPVIDGLVSLGEEFDVPLSMHVEAGSHRYFQPLCKRHPAARMLWAHAGGVLDAASVAELLEACPNVWVDLSARDPMRYGAMHPITGADGQLLPEWEHFVLNYQDRVVVGSDPFFRAEQTYWDEPNTGWDHLGTSIGFHRKWLAHLPEDTARKIRLDNALRLLRVGSDRLRR